MAKVIVQNLIKFYGKVIGIKNLSLEIQDGEFMVLLGPSGCGKTTTLEIIAGLRKEDSGDIFIGDDRVNKVIAKERDVAVVFQDYALYPHMTAYKNLAFPLKMRKVPRNEIKKKVHSVAELMGVDELLDRLPRELSGGQKQRIALGRAIIRQPKIFLMDEPLSNLDAQLRLQMRAELKHLQKELGVTTIYVTHDQEEAMTLGDRVAILKEGFLQQIGRAEELFYNPINKFVAGFIGAPSSSFLEGTVIWENGEFKFKKKDVLFEIPKKFWGVLEGYKGSSLIAGIKPLDIKISKDAGPGRIKGELFVYEPMGDLTIVTVKIGDTLLKVKYVGVLEGEIGQKVWLNIDYSKINFFDPKTEKSISV